MIVKTDWTVKVRNFLAKATMVNSSSKETDCEEEEKEARTGSTYFLATVVSLRTGVWVGARGEPTIKARLIPRTLAQQPHTHTGYNMHSAQQPHTHWLQHAQRYNTHTHGLQHTQCYNSHRHAHQTRPDLSMCNFNKHWSASMG